MSKTRKVYMLRLVGRCIVLVLAFLLYFFRKTQLDIVTGGFFHKLSLLHLLWVVWMIDMVHQLLPARKHIVALGSQKIFGHRSVLAQFDAAALKRYIVTTGRAAWKVVVLWCALGAAIGALYFTGVIDAAILFLCSVVFYVCDLICVLIWCPFRLILGNKCCTTCRIFNWDHIMMFTPLIFVPSFFCWSLAAVAIVVVAAWEIGVLLHPERFWEQSNAALRCANCTDKLCTQYCQKLR